LDSQDYQDHGFQQICYKAPARKKNAEGGKVGKEWEGSRKDPTPHRRKRLKPLAFTNAHLKSSEIRALKGTNNLRQKTKEIISTAVKYLAVNKARLPDDALRRKLRTSLHTLKPGAHA